MIRWKIVYVLFMVVLASCGAAICVECTQDERWSYLGLFFIGSFVLWFTFFGKEVPIGIWVSRENKWALGWSAFLGIATIAASLSWMIRGELF